MKKKHIVEKLEERKDKKKLKIKEDKTQKRTATLEERIADLEKRVKRLERLLLSRES
ncbi:hypothetical protein [Geoglobus acetivorans]|uniref:Uncharacterized protein n=1 Tax=Geoglobus acetivorans TaxID=565033 RepID=A0A0A7GG05_GEOAI|nr:hypothetical protein GACE_2276 [Geoglobus acetivorans]